MSELKPCPFCGSKRVKLKEFGRVIRWIRCQNSRCTFSAMPLLTLTKREIVRRWNRREVPQ